SNSDEPAARGGWACPFLCLVVRRPRLRPRRFPVHQLRSSSEPRGRDNPCAPRVSASSGDPTLARVSRPVLVSKPLVDVGCRVVGSSGGEPDGSCGSGGG